MCRGCARRYLLAFLRAVVCIAVGALLSGCDFSALLCAQEGVFLRRVMCGLPAQRLFCDFFLRPCHGKVLLDARWHDHVTRRCLARGSG
jgi:hypothetical protein